MESMPSVLTLQDTLPQGSGTLPGQPGKGSISIQPRDWYVPTNLWVQFLYLCN